MKSKLTVAVWAGNGIGGTAKAAVLFAVELVRRGHRVMFLSPSGPRDPDLLHGNVPRINPPAEATGLAEFLKTEQVDLIHQHVTDYARPTPIHDALRLLGDQRPRLIETNVFGRVRDSRGDQWVDFRCFVSRACAVQTFQRSGRPFNGDTLAKSTVLSNPLAPLNPAIQARSYRDEIRKELGIQANELLILRFGREGAKWCRDEVAVFQQVRRRNPLLRMLLMEPRKDIWSEVESGKWGEGILLWRALSDFDQVAAIYSAGDLMLHMSEFGESFGYTIAEAMQHGLPVVTRSTPWRDNAQVELVEHGATGFVCCSRQGAAECVIRLAGDSDLRAQFGASAVERIGGLSNLDYETNLLEEIMRHVVQGEPLKKVTERNHQLVEFDSSFAEREKRAWELEAPGPSLSYLKGAGYIAYRAFRNKAGHIKRALRRHS
jgi:glycosyltransferase involved in cell wall biosynthesis